MKTARERAAEIANYLDIQGLNYNKLVRHLEIAIKEQDRDTRHACAEAVVALRSVYLEVTSGLIFKDAAHAACMNVKAC